MLGFMVGDEVRTSKQGNVRKKPDRKADLVERVDKHARLEILSFIEEDNVVWANVRVLRSRRQGYIMADLLEPMPTPTPVPTPSPEPTPTPVPTPTPYNPVDDLLPESEQYDLRTAKSANLRKDPSRNALIVQQLDRYSKVHVMNAFTLNEQEWYYVRVLDRFKHTGFILQDLLEPIPTPSPTPTPSPVPTPSPTPTPEPPKLEDLEQTFEEPMLMRSSMKTNVRKTPNGERIGAVEKRTKLTAVGRVEWEGQIWLHVRATSSTPSGYILEELLEQIRPVVLVPVTAEEVRAKFPVVGNDPMGDIKDEVPFTYSEDDLKQYITLEVGSRNQDVLRLRQRLYELGYYRKENNSLIYTKATSDIIKIFQKDVGIEATGIADPYTQALLYDDRILPRENSSKSIYYLNNKEMPLWIQRAEISSYDYYGSVQVSVRNRTDGKLTAFGIRVIPNSNSGEPMGFASTILKQASNEINIQDIAIAPNRNYSDFETNELADWEYTWPHHFLVAYQTYFPGCQAAISWYRSGGVKYVIEDDQLCWVSVGKVPQEIVINTMPIAITDEEEMTSRQWSLGMETHYILPVYQQYYSVPQGALVESVSQDSPAEEAGLEPGDIIIGINDITILGDATLKKARGQMSPGEIARLYFYRNGEYFYTELIRPAMKTN